MVLKKLTRTKSFVPECFGNKSQKEDERIQILYSRLPSGAEIGMYKRFRFKDGATEVVYDDNAMILNHVERIINLQIDTDVIGTPEKLLTYPDARLYDLIVEIRRDLLDSSEELEEGE